MKNVRTAVAVTVVIAGLLWVPRVLAQKEGPPPEYAKKAFQMLLSETDKDGDGKISMEECYSIWKGKEMAEKHCKAWDTDGDGTITEEEYVAKATKPMR